MGTRVRDEAQHVSSWGLACPAVSEVFPCVFPAAVVPGTLPEAPCTHAGDFSTASRLLGQRGFLRELGASICYLAVDLPAIAF